MEPRGKKKEKNVAPLRPHRVRVDVHGLLRHLVEHLRLLARVVEDKKIGLVLVGLVERVDVEGDRRAYRVRLTARGRRLFHEMAREHEQWIVDAFDALSEREVATLHKLLGKVKEHSQNQTGTEAA